jgi:hypothetical protein
MNASEVKETGLAELELAIKHRIAQRTAGRIHALAVSVDADRIEIRGQAASFHLKQLAIQGVLETIQLWHNAPALEIDVRITVLGCGTTPGVTRFVSEAPLDEGGEQPVNSPGS